MICRHSHDHRDVIWGAFVMLNVVKHLFRDAVTILHNVMIRDRFFALAQNELVRRYIDLSVNSVSTF